MPQVQQVGVLLAATPPDWSKYIAAFRVRLNRLNPNANIIVLPPNGAAGDPASIASTASYLADNVDVIVTASTQAALACKAATQKNQTPFVFASVGDPAISGLTPVAGGNFTGGSNQQVKLVPQRVAFMKANGFVGPVAVVGNYNTEPIRSAMTLAVSTLQSEGMQPQLAAIAPGTDIATFVSGLKQQGIKSLYVCSDMYITANATQLNARAHAGPVSTRIKTMFEILELVTDHGGDASFGVSFQGLFEKAAEYADQILRGTIAGSLPIYEPAPSTRVQMVRKQARAAPPRKKK